MAGFGDLFNAALRAVQDATAPAAQPAPTAPAAPPKPFASRLLETRHIASAVNDGSSWVLAQDSGIWCSYEDGAGRSLFVEVRTKPEYDALAGGIPVPGGASGFKTRPTTAGREYWGPSGWDGAVAVRSAQLPDPALQLLLETAAVAYENLL